MVNQNAIYYETIYFMIFYWDKQVEGYKFKTDKIDLRNPPPPLIQSILFTPHQIVKGF